MQNKITTKKHNTDHITTMTTTKQPGSDHDFRSNFQFRGNTEGRIWRPPPYECN